MVLSIDAFLSGVLPFLLGPNCCNRSIWARSPSFTISKGNGSCSCPAALVLVLHLYRALVYRLSLTLAMHLAGPLVMLRTLNGCERW